MNKKGVERIVIAVLVIAIIFLAIFLIVSYNSTIDGHSIAPPPQILPERTHRVCGDGDCEGSEDYYSCPEDCCGEEGYQVRTPNGCCEGLTAVQDICEFEWPEEDREKTAVLPPPPPPSTEAIKEFFTGEAVAPPPTTPVEPPSMCWFCVNCGNGICDNHETSENCGIDCAVCGNGICEPPNETYTNCPQDCCAEAGYRGPAIVNCCEGLTKVDPCDVEPRPDYCMFAVVYEACINCGDGKCDEYETIENCPQDCAGNVTSCEELPELEVNALDRNSQIKFTWQADSIIPGSKLYLQKSNECVGKECDWGEEILIAENYQPNAPSEYSIDMPEEKLKFYRIKAKVKIGPGSCEPQCLASCSDLHVEGWCDPCTNTLLKATNCQGAAQPTEPTAAESESSGKKAYCCFVGTRSQGWYDVDCDRATTENLIVYDQKCHLPSQICDQPSNILAKFTQELIQPPSETTAATSINWMNFLNVWGIQDSEQLLKMGGLFDYVAYWDAEKQESHGTAEGDPHWVCGEVGKKQHCWLERVFTGVFEMKQGHPYFVSLRQPQIKMTYVGKVPERVTFELKYGPENSAHENYIVLPLDTTIKKASQLCDIRDKDGNLIIDQEQTIVWWNPSTQQSEDNGYTCSEIIRRPYPPYNFDVGPEQIYKIFVQRDANWKQI